MGLKISPHNVLTPTGDRMGLKILPHNVLMPTGDRMGFKMVACGGSVQMVAITSNPERERASLHFSCSLCRFTCKESAALRVDVS